jgi:hypothetical protein
MIRPPLALCVSGALLLALPHLTVAADVCRLQGQAFRTEVEAAAAEIAEAYARATPGTKKTRPRELTLNGRASGGSTVERACNWGCAGGRILTPLVNAFSFLPYHCSSTTATGGRRPTGKGTDSQMGLAITDAEYEQATNKIFRPGSTGVGDLMRVPRELELAAETGDVKKLTAAVAKLPGATWMRFSSTSVDNDGQGAERVIIRVVDGQARFEQWIQFAINESSGQLGRNVDFLAVQLRSDSGSPLPGGRPAVAFRGFSRTSQGLIPEGGAGARRELSRCYSCHPTGLRAVIPAVAGARAAGGSTAVKPTGTIPLTGPDNITDLTQEMPHGLAQVSPAGYTASHHGPPLGPSKRSGRDQFVARGLPARPGRAAVPGCAASLTPGRRQAVVANMDCQACHDGQTERNILNAATSVDTIHHKVVENTVAPMPPGSVWAADPSLALSAAEREILFACLQAEYAEILQEWLTVDLLAVP